MPRLSLYRPEKGNDYKYIDRQISEMFQVGGTDVYLHKYLGTNTDPTNATAATPNYATTSITNIQDLLLLENRDRTYDTSIYTIRGIYNVADIDFNLSQFGLFIDNDTVFMTVHINDFIQYIGRKPISGDVVELPHLKDEFALNTADVALPRFFVITEVGRAAEGFSRTWYPHLYRLKLNKISNQQQYASIFNVPTDANANFVGPYTAGTTYTAGQIISYQGQLYTVTNTTSSAMPPDVGFFTPYTGTTLAGVTNTAAINLSINDGILAQAEADAPLSGYETRQFFTLAVDPETGHPLLKTVDESTITADMDTEDASAFHERPSRTGYTGYLVGDGFPDNGYYFGHGISFPVQAQNGDFFLRTDFLPNRLFKYDGQRWLKYEDDVRTTMTNTDTRNTLKGGFINNTTVNEIAGQQVQERQALSKALRPKADL
jgi:hypothetical protein